jgi:dipeptidyl aminopeptidase/acylaminoacyl peptidase
LPAHIDWVPMRWAQDSSWALLLGVDIAGQLQLARVDAHSTDVQLLVSETVPAVYPYLLAVSSAVRTPIAGTADPMWASDRDGDLRLYRIRGEDWVPLTPAGVQVDQAVEWGPDGSLFVLARPDSKRPYDVYLCQVDGVGGLDPVKALPSTVDPPDEAFTVTAADGCTELHGGLYYPADFNPDRSYPVIDCIYGGPQTITNPTGVVASPAHLWGSSSTLAAALARLGFATVVLDGRGTPGRGRAFQWPLGDRCQIVVDDHIGGLRQLGACRPWFDLSRCGAIGTSFGAYYALRCGLTAPDLFRVVVAHAGPYDLERVLPGWFPALLGTTYIDDPGTYRAAGILAHAKQIDSQLLLIHGLADRNVTVDHTLRLSDALTAAGKDHQLLLLGGQSHHLDPPAAKDALDRAARFLLDHLDG